MGIQDFNGLTGTEAGVRPAVPPVDGEVQHQRVFIFVLQQREVQPVGEHMKKELIHTSWSSRPPPTHHQEKGTMGRGTPDLLRPHCDLTVTSL